MELKECITDGLSNVWECSIGGLQHCFIWLVLLDPQERWSALGFWMEHSEQIPYTW